MLFGLLNGFCFGQELINDKSIITKYRIDEIDKVIESVDTNGNKKLTIPYKYHFNKNGTLKTFECNSIECGFYTDVKRNFSIFKYFYNDSGQLILIKYKDALKKELYDFQYVGSHKRIETRYEIHKMGLFKKSKVDYFIRESILDSLGREIQVISTYRLSGQKDTSEYSYNAHGQKSSISRSNPVKNIMYYDYTYNSNGQTIQIFEVYQPNHRELFKEFFYKNDGLIDKEIEHILDIPITYQYKYRHW